MRNGIEKLFLVTTADEKFWKTDGKILFLGQWCLLFDQNIKRKSLCYEVLPYHWDDREKLRKDFLFLNQIKEKYLFALTKNLNNIHKVKFSTDFWRLAFAYWLPLFIDIVFDRYTCIKQASTYGEISNCWISDFPFGSFTPKDSRYLSGNLHTDELNEKLYSRIIEYSGLFQFEKKSLKPTQKPLSAHCTINHYGKWKEIYKKLLFLGQHVELLPLFFKWGKSRKKDYVFVTSYIKMLDLFALQASLGQVPSFPPDQIQIADTKTDVELRKSLCFGKEETQFEKILSLLIAENLPKVFLENFLKYKQIAMNCFPKRPKIIITENSFSQDDCFKIWASYCRENFGAKVIISQHGGYYGIGKWSTHEEVETKISDVYFSWGWEKKNEPKVQPLPSGKLRSQKIFPKPQGKILCALASLPRYSYFLYCVPIASQFSKYLADQESFFLYLPKEIQESVLLRLNPSNHGWSEAERIKEKFPQIEIFRGNKPNFLEQLKECRLFIGTYNATTFLETFAANFPTIIFWNPDHWELKEEAEKYFQQLEEAEIFHRTPESAAKKVTSIFQDPLVWWQSPAVQTTVKEFCSHFAQSDPNWKKAWKEKLLAIYADARCRPEIT
ncbi:MAG: hypothetical protein HQM08_20925 [Candidatus Riflebacteria bacterium]|nr:hypothetical protein [Candidatus Riflebacteria bacterium]